MGILKIINIVSDLNELPVVAVVGNVELHLAAVHLHFGNSAVVALHLADQRLYHFAVVVAAMRKTMNSIMNIFFGEENIFVHSFEAFFIYHTFTMKTE